MVTCTPDWAQIADDVVGVHLGSAGLGVIQVTPGQHVDVRQPTAGCQLRDGSSGGLAGDGGLHVGGGLHITVTGRAYATQPNHGGRRPSPASRPTPPGATVKLTGERPIEGETPDSLLGLHAAGYREVRSRVGAGRMLDLGCGLGDGTVSFAADDRMLVGVDYDQETASSAVRLHPEVDLRTVCSDGAVLPLRTGCVRRRLLVAPHRALRRPGVPRRRDGAGARRRRSRLLPHPEQARRLREPLPRVPVRPRGPPLRCSNATSPG